MDRQWWKKLNWILFLQVGSKFSRRRYDLRRVQQSNCACRASSHEGWFAILLSTCSSASRGDNEKDKSLHDVTWCEWHLESELPGCLQHPRKPPNLSLLDAGQLFLVETVLKKIKERQSLGLLAGPLHRDQCIWECSLHSQSSMNCIDSCEAFLETRFTRRNLGCQNCKCLTRTDLHELDWVGTMIQWTWQNWMVGIFVAFGVQLLLVVIATIAFAKLCWAACLHRVWSIHNLDQFGCLGIVGISHLTSIVNDAVASKPGDEMSDEQRQSWFM